MPSTSKLLSTLSTLAASTLRQANHKSELPIAVKEQLIKCRKELLGPALNDESPFITKEERKVNQWQCADAGFFVHGADGRDIVAMRASLLRVIASIRFRKAIKLDRVMLVASNVVVAVIADRHVVRD